MYWADKGHLIYSHTGLVASEGEGWAGGQRDTLDLGCTGLTGDT